MNSNMKAPFKLANARPGLLFLLRDSERMRWAPSSSLILFVEFADVGDKGPLKVSILGRERDYKRCFSHRDGELFNNKFLI